MSSRRQTLKELYTTSALYTPRDAVLQKLEAGCGMPATANHLGGDEIQNGIRAWERLFNRDSKHRYDELSESLANRAHISKDAATSELKDLAEQMRTDYWQSFCLKDVATNDLQRRGITALKAIPARVAVDVMHNEGFSDKEIVRFTGDTIRRSIFGYMHSSPSTRSDQAVEPQPNLGEAPANVIAAVTSWYDRTVTPFLQAGKTGGS